MKDIWDDVETKLYYLNSRYYNPLWRRFINADGVINENHDLFGYNLYAYCSNDFINNIDIIGKGKFKNFFKKNIGNFALGLAVVTSAILGGTPLLVTTLTTILVTAVASATIAGVNAKKDGANRQQISDAVSNGFNRGYTNASVSSAATGIGGVAVQHFTRKALQNAPFHVETSDKVVGYTYHGFESVYTHNEYGVSNQSILNTVNNPIQISYSVEKQTFKYYGETSIVVLNHEGQVVTTWAIDPSAYRFK